MFGFAFVRRGFPVLLALALAVGQPVAAAGAPGASPPQGDDARHAVHVHHAGGHELSKAAAPDTQPCPQHSSCDGQCCAACGHCVVGAILAPDLATAFRRSVEAPVVAALHAVDVLDPHLRPPQTPPV
jgi:hypothetical protein